MEILKNLFVIAVLGAVCYGVYVSLSSEPTASLPEEESELAGGAVGEVSASLGTAIPSSGGIDPFASSPSADVVATQDVRDATHQPVAADQELTASRGVSSIPELVLEADPPMAAGPDANPAADPAGNPYPDTTYPDLAPPAATSQEAGGRGLAMANTAPSGQFTWRDVLESVEPDLAANQLANALLKLTPWYIEPRLPPQDQEELVKLLDQLACTVIYYREHYLEPPYQVQPGETLADIADRYQVPWQLLANINGILDPNSLRPGEQLKVIRGPFSADIDLNARQLTLMVDGRYAGRFEIFTNPGDTIVEGPYRVRTKEDTHTVSSYPAQSAPNWIGLSDTLGIHGGHSEFGGSAPLSGCIQVSDQDIADLRSILSIDSPVTIHR